MNAINAYKTALIILTHNASAAFDQQLAGIVLQTLQPTYKLIIDSASSDDTVKKAKAQGFVCHTIKPSEFNHGATRQLAIELIDADIYIFMTQDAMPVDKYSLANLITAFVDQRVGCAYGRQLPSHNASLLAAHARIFNYPAVSAIKSYDDRDRLGIKTCFNSDSFAAYRKEALQKTGGFPHDIILSEDTYVAAKMLMQGWKVAYCAEALVYHSHNYSIVQEFKRYFDIGVFHAMNLWLLQTFHEPHGEGIKYVKSEFGYCLSHHAYLALLKSVITVGAKYLGYKLGRHFSSIPLRLRKKLSMNYFYWRL